jgi:hypothetical protein
MRRNQSPTRRAEGVFAALERARCGARTEFGRGYSAIVDPLVEILRLDVQRFGVTPVDALRMHFTTDLTRRTQLLWMAACAELVAESVGPAERMAS